MSAQHTPTPYTLLGGTRIWLTGADERSVGSIHRPEDADFIVRACNSHDALVEACELIVGAKQEATLAKALGAAHRALKLAKP